MKRISLFLIVALSTVCGSNLSAQETVMMRCYQSQTGVTQRIEVYSPNGVYERIELEKWDVRDDKAIQVKISKKIDEINQKGFKLVSLNELVIPFAPFWHSIYVCFFKELSTAKFSVPPYSFPSFLPANNEFKVLSNNVK